MASSPQGPSSNDSNNNDENGSDNLVWYFAIGSMMHPAQCKNRKFVPIQSRPAKLLGFELGFFGRFGVAEAVEKPGATMHGVLHQVTQSQMKQLDQIEVGYFRKQGRAIPYGGNEEESSDSLEATVYCRDDNKVKALKACNSSEEEDEVVPTQRYIELLAEGATIWGVDNDYIEVIRNRKIRLRKNPADFRTVPPPDKSFETIPEDTETEVFFSLNGKIMCYKYPADHPMYKMHRGIKAGYGPHLEVSTAQLLYDTKYGAPSSLDQFTKEHSGYIEDLTWEFMTGRGNEMYVEVVGTYAGQKWIDG